MEEPIVYQKQPNEEGRYIDKDGSRFDILTCHHTESREQVQVGTTTETDEEGNEIEVPVYESRVVINKGWDSFDSLEQAMEAYGLEIYQEPEQPQEQDDTEEKQEDQETEEELEEEQAEETEQEEPVEVE